MWATDVTEFKINNDKLYLSPIVDLFNGEIVRYNMSRHPVFNQIVDMLEKAFKKIPDKTNLILHSDQGWQYQMKQYQISNLIHTGQLFGFSAFKKREIQINDKNISNLPMEVKQEKFYQRIISWLKKYLI